MRVPGRWPRGSATCLFVCLTWSLISGATAPPPRGLLPTSFTMEVVASGLAYPTGFAALPDGRILIAEKGGVVRLLKNGVLQPTPFIDLQARVNAHHDRGLLGLAVDPAFSSNGFVYLLYTYDDDDTDDDGPKTARLARYTAVGDTASPGSEYVLLGTVVGHSCNEFPQGTDCIPSDSPSHTVGSVRFAPDGTLFVTLGDGARFDGVDDDALRAQDVDSLAGKVLHVTRDGKGIPSNPFWNGDANANRSKVWAYGLRNPYRFNLRPDNGVPYLGDVGWNDYEEINVASAGANLGWPCYEGDFRQPGYAPKPLCQALYGRGPSAVKGPLYVWDHGVGRTATGGAFYTGAAYPDAWRGAYFFADYGERWIRTLRVDGNDTVIPGSVTEFATDVGGLVALDVGPDSNLYAVDIVAGELRRLRYTAGNTPPTAVASATPTNGGVPLRVRFSSAGSKDVDGDALRYRWTFGDDSLASALANPEHTYRLPGRYTAQLTVSDGRGGSHSATLRIDVGNYAPTVSITAPSAAYRFSVGDVVTYSGTASDKEDGAIPADRLSWRLTLQHCSGGTCHAHPYSTSTGPSGTFTVADHGDEVFFELTLTATDSKGLTSSSTVTLHPRTVQLALETSPPGLELVFDGTEGPAPRVRTVIAGSTHTVYAPSPQADAFFHGWTDGGPQQREVVAGTSDATYTALFVPESVDECPDGTYRAEYFNNPGLFGVPVLTRCESAPLSHDWGEDSPAPLWLGTDGFSVRWSGRFYLFSGGYFFAAEADDGVRVDLDGSRIIDGWTDQAPTAYVTWRYLRSGYHRVVMEYYENGGGAVARLYWYR
ncbi:PQQ-dependent sugar dehydrogenase [Pyxidicoccus parkwayensis]|uniref:PQQ-dependent sugar dehydrogenase n=1 Tax=Pyxidicoccus parkwayensis TaxID=2813578 RepID=A0ABX7P5M9_9BACT|nr:PQQ-dependent sugar dehydrogenase [Pyxidicoccus parkwaysis]QSQ25795.1 PQQ-dependent sugar dehydrogenase [Pyxidicoccus parkwaysis]